MVVIADRAGLNPRLGFTGLVVPGLILLCFVCRIPSPLFIPLSRNAGLKKHRKQRGDFIPMCQDEILFAGSPTT